MLGAQGHPPRDRVNEWRLLNKTQIEDWEDSIDGQGPVFEMGERTGKGNESTRLGLEQNKQRSKPAGTKVGDGTVFKDTKLHAICPVGGKI